MAEGKNLASDEKPFGDSPFKGKAPASFIDQLHTKIESLPQAELEAAYAGVEQALKENKAAPGAALKSVAGFLIGMLKPG